MLPIKQVNNKEVVRMRISNFKAIFLFFTRSKMRKLCHHNSIIYFIIEYLYRGLYRGGYTIMICGIGNLRGEKATLYVHTSTHVILYYFHRSYNNMIL